MEKTNEQRFCDIFKKNEENDLTNENVEWIRALKESITKKSSPPVEKKDDGVMFPSEKMRMFSYHISGCGIVNNEMKFPFAVVGSMDAIFLNNVYDELYSQKFLKELVEKKGKVDFCIVHHCKVW